MHFLSVPQMKACMSVNTPLLPEAAVKARQEVEAAVVAVAEAKLAAVAGVAAGEEGAAVAAAADLGGWDLEACHFDCDCQVASHRASQAW